MGFFERMLGNLMRVGLGGHHGSYRGGHRGDFKHGDHGGYRGYPQAAGNSCPKCGSVNTTNARFCQQCGVLLSVEKCSDCDTELAVGAKFCGQCGKPRQ